MILVGFDDFPLFALLLLVLRKGGPLKDVLFGVHFSNFVQEENNAAVKSDDGGVYIDFVFHFLNCFLGNSHIFLQIEDLHLVVFFNLKLVLNLFAHGGFEEKTDLSVVDFHHFSDDFVREIVDCHFFIVSPYEDVLLLDVNPNEFLFSVDVQVLDRIFIRFSIEKRLSVILELPSLDPLIRNAEIFFGLRIFYNYLFKLLLFMTERTDVLSSLLGTDIDFICTDLAIVSVVNVCQIVYIFYATISFFQFP